MKKKKTIQISYSYMSRSGKVAKSENREYTNFFHLSKYDISELRKNNKESKYTFRKLSYKARSTLMARSGELPFASKTNYDF